MTALLPQLLVIFSVAIIVTILCHRISVPPIVGLLFTGMLVGPAGLRLIDSAQAIEILAEVGVILLLFSIGTEFSLRGLLRIKYFVAVGGIVQMSLTVFGTYAIAKFFGVESGQALMFGFIASLGSTALVLKLLRERAELDTLSGKAAFAILLFQDLSLVPLMLIVPFLGSGASLELSTSPWWATFGKGLIILASVLVAASWAIPKILHLALRTEDRELFLLTIIVICFSVAFITREAGLSLPLGALLAGLIVSESEYSHHALGNVLPFQQVFIALFFVSVGMLLNVQFAWTNALLISGLTIAVIVGKVFLAIPAGLMLGLPLRTSIVSSLAIAQIGEFSFVLAQAGVQNHVLSQEAFQAVLSVSVLTLITTPFLIALSPKLADLSTRLPLPALLRTGWHSLKTLDLTARSDEIRDHTVIIGFGTTGQTIARAAELDGIPYVVLDIAATMVRVEQAAGRPVFYGDATQREVLIRHGIRQAKVGIVTVLDPVVARRIVSRIRALNADCFIIARTRLLGEGRGLRLLGADEVVIEELESARSMTNMFLARYRMSNGASAEPSSELPA